MAGMTLEAGTWRGSIWRRLMWGGAAALLAVPAVAMRFTNEVNWTAGDFIVMGLILAIACGGVDFGMRQSSNLAYRAGVVAAVGGAFLLVWINLAVGILGSEDNPANAMYVAVPATGAIGAVLSRMRARGLAWTLLAMAAVQALVPVIAAALGGLGPATPVGEAAGVTVFFATPWLMAAALFRLAARTDASARGGTA